MPSGPLERVHRFEDAAAVAALLAMAAIPVVELALRNALGIGIPGAGGYVEYLTLWVAFIGVMIASREGRHLGLAAGEVALPAAWRAIAGAISTAASVAVAAGLLVSAFHYVVAETASAARIAGWLPVWIAETVLPAAFAVALVRFWVGGSRWAGAVGLAAALGVAMAPNELVAALVWPGIVALVLAVASGAPIFVALGGAALLLFHGDGVPVAAVAVEVQRIVVSPTIPTIPLFTLTGYLLAEGGAGPRLVRLFRALFGWAPGGMVVATILVCAFFTTFTGASGVTIVALGGLLLPVLVQNGFGERFALGLVTSTGSIGLMFPPSLAVILYAVIARVAIPDLFLAALVPGVLMVAALGTFGVIRGHGEGVRRTPFEAGEAARAAWQAKWEIVLPVIVLGGIFGGFATLVEAAALTVVYTLAVQTIVHREMSGRRDVPAIVLRCATLIGGVFVILGAAMGLTNYLVDAEVPMKAADWVQAHLDSRLAFLIALNVSLLIVGCLMDIFSAIVVAVPLILPIAEAFGIAPLHLGVIFLVNLELGYLTPPVGMNVFLAAFRFEKPLTEIWRAVLPFFAVLLAVVLLVTYVPALSLWLPGDGAQPNLR